MYIKDRYIHMLNLRFSDFYMSPTALVQLSAFLKEISNDSYVEGQPGKNWLNNKSAKTALVCQDKS